MGNWKVCELGDLITFQRGHDLPKSQVIEGKYPIAGSNGIIGYHKEFTTKAPSITIGRSGNIGNPHLYEVDFWAHNTALYIKEFKNADPKFIFYLLKTLDFTGHNSGSAVPSLNRNFIHPTKVFVPESIEEQKAIAKILSSLDDKIELNRRMNETLEAIARALFKAWFVDFEPVRANAENRPSESASPEIAKLFPSEFENGIPKGWKYKPLGEMADVNWGDTSTTKQSYGSEGYPAYSASGSDGLLSYFDFDETGIVISAIGANSGLTWLAKGKWSAIKNTMTIFANDKAISTEYLYLATLGKEYWTLRGSAQPFISQNDTRAKRILYPSNGIAKIFGSMAEKFYETIDSNLLQNKKLAEIRDSLLPRLISGKIPVSKIESEAAGEKE